MGSVSEMYRGENCNGVYVGVPGTDADTKLDAGNVSTGVGQAVPDADSDFPPCSREQRRTSRESRCVVHDNSIFAAEGAYDGCHIIEKYKRQSSWCLR